MKSLAVVFVITTSLCGFFQKANGMLCYSCLNCVGNVSHYTKVTCKNPDKSVVTMHPVVPFELTSTEAHNDEDGTRFPIEPQDVGTHFCYTAKLHAGHVQRGCTKTNDCEGKKKLHFKSCKTCSSDYCNGAEKSKSVVPGISVQCALINSMVIARMFFQNK